MTEQEQQAFYQQIIERSSQQEWFAPMLEIQYDHLDSKSAEAHFVAKRKHCNPFGIVHGGAYYTLMDQMAGMAASATGRGGVTLDCSVSYLKSAHEGDTVRCRLDAIRLGHAIAVYEAKCFGENGELQAVGTFHLFFLKPAEDMLEKKE